MIWGSELWILSAVPERKSCCTDTGQTIDELLREQGPQLMGEHLYARFGDTFPLLIKFIEANDDLSVQVHPADELARKYGHPWGKTEMWYALPSKPGAQIFCGLKQPLTPEEYKRKVDDKTILDAVAQFEVNDGDCFFIPAGRIHAIGSGCRVCEIQQTSDLTYRIYDYDRRDKNGNARELHTELAAECINYEDYKQSALRSRYTDTSCPLPTANCLFSCAYFTTNILRLNDTLPRDYSALDSFVCLVILEGEGTIEEMGRDGSVNSQAFNEGDLLLLPATTQNVTLHGTLRALEVYIDQ